MSGEAIYRGYDRAALDAQYNNRARIPEYVDYFRPLAGLEREDPRSATGRAGYRLRRAPGRDPRHLSGGAA